MSKFFFDVWYNHREKMLYFFLAGFSSIADFAMFLTLAGSLGIFLATALSAAAAAFLSFFLNARFTFSSRPRVHHLLRFFIVVGIASLTGGVLVQALSLAGLVDWISKLTSMALMAFVQFVVHSRWTFR